LRIETFEDTRERAPHEWELVR